MKLNITMTFFFWSGVLNHLFLSKTASFWKILFLFKIFFWGALALLALGTMVLTLTCYRWVGYDDNKIINQYLTYMKDLNEVQQDISTFSCWWHLCGGEICLILSLSFNLYAKMFHYNRQFFHKFEMLMYLQIDNELFSFDGLTVYNSVNNIMKLGKVNTRSTDDV